MKRRNFVRTVMGIPFVFGVNFPKGLIPIELLGSTDISDIEGKSNQLSILNDRPLNAETPAHLLNDDLTPNHLFFVRNNGIPPSNIDIKKWTLTVRGESAETEKELKPYTS